MIRATALALLIALAGCGGNRGAFTRVEFRAPSQPDPVLRPFLADVDHIGVVCATNIEPFRELDIEKVMARLSNAVVRSLGNMPKTEVMNQDEITYQLKDIRLDSTSVHQDSVQAVLRKELELDALVFVELRHLQARMMPMSPTPYGMSPNPGIDLTIDLKVSLINPQYQSSLAAGGHAAQLPAGATTALRRQQTRRASTAHGPCPPTATLPLPHRPAAQAADPPLRSRRRLGIKKAESLRGPPPFLRL